MANVIPDTETISVAALAVPWKTARLAYLTGNIIAKKESGKVELTNLVIESYNAILAMKELEK